MKKLIFFITICLNISVRFAEEIDVFKLVENGTPEQLQSALKQGAKFNVGFNMSDFDEDHFEALDYWPFDTGETPLHRTATYNHNPESIKFMIEQGLDVNAVAECGLLFIMNQRWLIFSLVSMPMLIFAALKINPQLIMPMNYRRTQKLEKTRHLKDCSQLQLVKK